MYDMKIEKVIAKFPLITILAAVFFLAITSWLVYILFVQETTTTNWKMNVVGIENISSGRVSDIQLFLEDEEGIPITNAKVSVWLDMPEMNHLIKKPMHHIEDGLYGTEAILSMGGTWIGMVKAKRGSQIYHNQFILLANGPLVSKDYRDPHDQFDFKQPLPHWVEMQLNE